METSVWPGGRRLGVVLSFDFDAEEVWIGEDPRNANRPGVLSQGTYGARVGVPAVLDLLRRHEVPATFFVPGRVAETHPAQVEQVVAAGHELAHHGYTHTSPTSLTRDQEEHELGRGRTALEAFGVEVVGYRSPSWDFSAHTVDLLRRHGFRYSSNLMSDVRPFLHPADPGEAPLVELPVQWILDDAAHFWFSGNSWTKAVAVPRHVREIWTEEVLGIEDMGGLVVLTLHPQIIGRPGRLRMLDAFVAWLRTREPWFATAREAADHALTAAPSPPP